MKLHYFHGRSPLRALVLIRQGRRVELHIKPVGEDVWALVALGGPQQQPPERHRCQGPYHGPAQAEAALRGAAGSLLESGYLPHPESHVVWSVMAQRLVRHLRHERDADTGRYRFDPYPHEPLD